MSLINGIAAMGSGLSSVATTAAQEEVSRASLLNNASPVKKAAEPEAASPEAIEATPEKAGPRMPPGVNPYGTGPHAAELWLAERAIMGPESGGKANAQNPISSAGGLFQIINPTWDAAIQKLGLPVAASDAERNAQKYQPELNTRVMRAINTEAARALDAQGLPVTPETLQAAHRLGPGGAAAAIKASLADPDAPLVGNGLAPDAVKGNGDVAGLTVGQFLARPYPRAHSDGAA